MAIVYVGLGSNLGDRLQALTRACAVLQHHPDITIEALSSLYHTAPVGVTSQDWFYNAVIRLSTTLSPTSLLAVTQGTERRLGRTVTFRWGPRVIDLDLLLYDMLDIRTPVLTIPHASLYERLFVLLPLYELAPELCFPSGVPIRDLLAALPNHDSVERLGPFPSFLDELL